MIDIAGSKSILEFYNKRTKKFQTATVKEDTERAHEGIRGLYVKICTDDNYAITAYMLRDEIVIGICSTKQ